MTKVCVIGSGVMGSAIAAQVANSEHQVILLDIASENEDRTSIANEAVEKLKKSRPAALAHPKFAKYIKTGNLDDDLGLVSNCDIIIEAIIEKLDIKHKLYDKILPHINDKAIIASNTSTLPLSALKAKLPKEVKERFIITHFFNPPRYMELLEIIYDDKVSSKVINTISKFTRDELGKTIIRSNDTPGFIANRIGCYLLELTVREAINSEFKPAEIDMIFSKFLGFPSTGIFGLYDLIGHDVMELISKSLIAALKESDDYHNIYQPNEVLDYMKSEHLLGRKKNAGFYKIEKKDGKTVKYQFVFSELSYEKINNGEVASSLEELFESKKYSKFIENILNKFFQYVINLVPDVSPSHDDIDKAMELGYSLKFGPFALIKQMPKGKFESQKKQLAKVNFADKHPSPKYELRSESESSNLYAAEDSLIFSINSKLCSLDKQVFNNLSKAIYQANDENKNLIIYPFNSNFFCAGANLKFFHEKASNKEYKFIEEIIILGQKTMLELKYSKAKTISVVKGGALGGGCEMMLHSHKIYAHQNIIGGLVEASIGLIPAFGGLKESFLRSENEEELLNFLANIIHATKFDSSNLLKDNFKLNLDNVMNKDNLLLRALETGKQTETKAFKNRELQDKLLEINLENKFSKELLDHFQLKLVEFLQSILDQKIKSEEDLLLAEKDQFMKLVKDDYCLNLLAKFR